MDIGTTDAFGAVEGWALCVIGKTQDPLVRDAAARWLSLLQSSAAYEPLVRVMWAHLDEPAASGLVTAVQDTGWERAIPELVKVLESIPPDAGNAERVQTYLAAAQALAELGDDRGHLVLERAASSRYPGLRREVPWHVSCLGKATARVLLERLSRDVDETTALRAQDALRALESNAGYLATPDIATGTLRLLAKQHERHTQWVRDHTR
jgi:hypothetical protein